MEKFDYPSSSSSAVYTVQINDDLHLSCNCPAWRIKKEGKPRDCKHCKDVIKTLKLTIEVRDVYQFVAAVGAPGEPQTETKIPASSSAGVAGAAPAKDRYISPMLASPMPDDKRLEDYSPELWVMDEKWDGHRVVVSTYNGNVQAWSRPGPEKLRGLDRTLPKHIVEPLREVPNGIYDGEIIVKGGQSWDVTAGSNSGKERLKFFDVMEILDMNIMSKPFEDRRKILETSLEKFVKEETFSLSPLHPVSREILNSIWNRTPVKGEGVVLKRLDSIYKPNWRADTWIKIKELFSATLTITGYKEGKNGPYSTVLLRDDDGNETRAKTVNNEWLRILNKDAAKYIGRRLVVEHRGRTPTGNYRHCMWDHIED